MKLKNIIISIICIIIIIFTYLNRELISSYLKPFIINENKIIVKENNNYTKKYSYEFINLTDNYTPYGYQDLLNIIYSVLNNGWNNFTFYCPKEYTNCLADLKNITSDTTLLTNINNFIHPFNSFENIKTMYDDTGKISLDIYPLYSDEEINIINSKILEISNKIINNNMTNREKIKAIHDYLIDNTKYDTERIKSGKSNYKSNSAYGVLIDGYGVCGGYSDAMAIFLNNLGINNYKIASNVHVWNALYLNNNWYHLDLTWDDPVSSDGTEYNIEKFFIIDTETLKNSDTDENHKFDSNIYLEFK